MHESRRAKTPARPVAASCADPHPAARQRNRQTHDRIRIRSRVFQQLARLARAASGAIELAEFEASGTQRLLLDNRPAAMKMLPVSIRAKALAVASACLFLSACASDGHLVNVQEAYAKNAWKGHHIGEALVKWGFPFVPPVHNADGTMVYQWVGQAGYAYDQQTGHADTAYGTVDFYEQRIGKASCSLSITTDAKGIITNLDTTQEIRGCTDSLFSTGLAPNAQTAAEGQALERQMRTIQVIDERFKTVCNDPQYSGLFDQSRCNMGFVSYIPNSKMTPVQRRALLSWNKEMTAVADDYKAFFLSTGRPGEADLVRMIDTQLAPIPQDDALMLEEKFALRLPMVVMRTSTRIRQFAQHSRRTYHQFGQ